VNAELPVELLHVPASCVDADPKMLCDLAGGEALEDQLRCLELTRRQGITMP
jgi:hypothetical protein